MVSIPVLAAETGLVHAPPGLGHDPLDDVQQVALVGEGAVSALETPGGLKVRRSWAPSWYRQRLSRVALAGDRFIEHASG